MTKNFSNLLVGELYQARTYYDRVLHALMDITPFGNTRDVKAFVMSTYFDLSTILESSLLQSKFSDEDIKQHSTRELRLKIRECTKVLESLLNLDLNSSAMTDLVCEFIDSLYNNAGKIHLHSLGKNKIDIQFPRTSILKVEELETDFVDSTFYTFSVDRSKLTESLGSGDNVLSMHFERDRKYDSLMQLGHKEIYSSNHEQALIYFKSALKVKETAEVLTLVGWCHSLKDDLDVAKDYCIKAINLDPTYGPPYNDIGNFLLTMGEVNDSLKWFAKAKKAVNYQNKEYPYINSGRAYIVLKEYDKAFIEFEEAIKIAPHNEELRQTVEKLQEGLLKENDIFDNLGHSLNNGDTDQP